MALPYVADPFAPRRRATRVVRVGDVEIGGANPIRVQSMTTSNTLDTGATADQIEALARAGCEIVRVTAPSIRDAENLAAIRAEMQRRGVRVPLVADIHFTPNAALEAALHVEKVRINPGNYADKKKFEIREYDDAQYGEELERVAERFRPLVQRCRERGVAMRIGTNHGSLSDRIMNRYGDTPLGMVESALEFLDVCEGEAYTDVVFSMKASNPQVAIQAYRLLAARLEERAPGEASYPFHVGVTEAGDGEDGRIKSAVGIGALLEDGIGDTIRVSLTEDPVREVPVAAALARRSEARWAQPVPAGLAADAAYLDDPYAHVRRDTLAVRLADGQLELGGGQPVRVEIDLGPAPADPEALASRVATALALQDEVACEALRVHAGDPEAWDGASRLGAALAGLGVAAPLAIALPAAFAAQLPKRSGPAPARLAVELDAETPAETLAAAAEAASKTGVPLEWALRGSPDTIPGLVDRALAAASDGRAVLLSVASAHPIHAVRAAVAQLRARGAGDVPLVLRHTREPGSDAGSAALAAAIELGAPLCDGLGEMVSLAGFDDAGEAVSLAYRILQAARQRTTWTEFISCPSCGRTLFDLEEVTAVVKSKTAHLPGVKIAVMGCIVNGPGEMADADFGYVGSGPGVVNLYVGQQVLARHVPEAEAPDRLVDLIRQEGRWVDPA